MGVPQELNLVIVEPGIRPHQSEFEVAAIDFLSQRGRVDHAGV